MRGETKGARPRSWEVREKQRKSTIPFVLRLPGNAAQAPPLVPQPSANSRRHDSHHMVADWHTFDLRKEHPTQFNDKQFCLSFPTRYRLRLGRRPSSPSMARCRSLAPVTR